LVSSNLPTRTKVGQFQVPLTTVACAGALPKAYNTVTAPRRRTVGTLIRP
jgi:hypothetical protein